MCRQTEGTSTTARRCCGIFLDSGTGHKTADLLTYLFLMSVELSQWFCCVCIRTGLLPHVAAVHPSSPLSIYFLIFSPFFFSLSFIGFTYFLLLSIPSLSTRIVPLRFQAGGRRRRPNLGLVCFFV